ncbi:MAG: FAD-dependent monooxygenase [Deltaproteobacteria bacterium]|nr:FAD-dependent monooxygenase [Deltaproteobacteria bacterium]
MHVGIVGGGTGGPALALFLARAGHEVTLYERVANPGPVGAGILLQPTGLEVLRRLGLEQRVLSHGARVERLHGTTRSNWVVLDLAYADWRPGAFGLGIQRGAVFGALWDAVLAEPSVRVRTGAEVHATGDEPGAAWIDTGERERFDLVVVASGARSEHRAPGARVTPYPWGALWVVAEADLHPGVLYQRYRDTREMAGILPSGMGTVSLFWSHRADAVEAWRRAPIEDWKARVRALLPEAPLDGVYSHDDVLFAPYFDVVASRWHEGRRAWIGDCAHAMSPQLGQGANLALVDAAVLAGVIERGEPLARYSELRADHLRFYSWASRALTPFFQSSYPVLAPLRDLGSPLFHGWGWYRRQMLGALAGGKTGVFSGDVAF